MEKQIPTLNLSYIPPEARANGRYYYNRETEEFTFQVIVDGLDYYFSLPKKELLDKMSENLKKDE